MAVIGHLKAYSAAGAALALGVAGLIGGAVPQTGVGHNASAAIVISGAYVRQPANDLNAAAYFTINNTTNSADVLQTISTGAGAQASLHTETASGMQLDADGLTIPAHSSVSLTPAKGHVMIEKLYGIPQPGQTVNLQLTFEKAGQILVTAPVIGILAPAPTGTASK